MNSLGSFLKNSFLSDHKQRSLGWGLGFSSFVLLCCLGFALLCFVFKFIIKCSINNYCCFWKGFMLAMDEKPGQWDRKIGES